LGKNQKVSHQRTRRVVHYPDKHHTSSSSTVAENEPIDCELLAEKECAQWILELLGRMYTDEFVCVGQMQKLNWSNTRIDGPTAAAMWSEANVYVYQQRIIRRYLVAIFGFCMIVPEAKIRGLVQDDIPPEAKKFVTNDGETIHYYMKPMDLILNTVIDDLVANSDHMMLEALTLYWGGSWWWILLSSC
jgi:hypothetical protein